MSALAYNHVEIAAKPLKASLLELDGKQLQKWQPKEQEYWPMRKQTKT